MTKNTKLPKNPIQFKAAFLCPKYWGIWLGISLLWFIHFLPLKIQFHIGKLLGKLLYMGSTKRRQIAKHNIDLGFPDLDDKERNNLLKQHYQNLGLSIIETAIAWWGSHRQQTENAKERQRVSYKGIENLEAAKSTGQGIMLLMPHFTHIEMTNLFLSFLVNHHPVYRPHNNPLMDYLIKKGRSMLWTNPSTGQLEHITPISKTDTRSMLKILKNGEAMAILTDQRYRKKGRLIVPFFGHDAKSNPAASKIAKLTNCLVVPTFTRRTDSFHYEMSFLPALEDFPSGDSHEDTLRLHQLYEEEIKANPAQYLWVHNRWDIKDPNRKKKARKNKKAG